MFSIERLENLMVERDINNMTALPRPMDPVTITRAP